MQYLSLVIKGLSTSRRQTPIFQAARSTLRKGKMRKGLQPRSGINLTVDPNTAVLNPLIKWPSEATFLLDLKSQIGQRNRTLICLPSRIMKRSPEAAGKALRLARQKVMKSRPEDPKVALSISAPTRGRSGFMKISFWVKAQEAPAFSKESSMGESSL